MNTRLLVELNNRHSIKEVDNGETPFKYYCGTEERNKEHKAKRFVVHGGDDTDSRYTNSKYFDTLEEAKRFRRNMILECVRNLRKKTNTIT